MVLVATVALTLRLINPPTYSATTVLQLPPLPNGESHPKHVIEQQLAFVRSRFIIGRALRDLKASALMLDGNSRLQIREPEGWTDVTGHISSPTEWLQSHLRVQLRKGADGTDAELVLWSTKGSSAALQLLVEAISRTHLNELEYATLRRQQRNK
jgi:hypothetical protein